MKRGSREAGYTIVEVLIVLAVSSLLFLVAVNFINGKQAESNFKAGVIEMTSRVNDLVNQVSDGHYTDQGFRCDVDSANNFKFTSDLMRNKQGTNEKCVFLGKQLVPNTADNKLYQVFSLAGRRLTVGDEPVASLAEAYPTPIKDTGPSGVDITEDFAVPQGLGIESIAIDKFARSNFGFAQGVGASTSGNYVTGSQSAQLIYSDALPINGLNVKTGQKVVICVSDDSRYAAIIIGSGTNSIGQSSGDLTPYTKYFGKSKSGCVDPNLSAFVQNTHYEAIA